MPALAIWEGTDFANSQLTIVKLNLIIHGHITAGLAGLVHCHAGQSRSVAKICIALPSMPTGLANYKLTIDIGTPICTQVLLLPLLLVVVVVLAVVVLAML